MAMVLAAPAGTPGAVVDRLYAEMAKVLLIQDIRDRMPGWGYETVGSKPHEFDKRFKSDLALYAKVIREARIPLQD